MRNFKRIIALIIAASMVFCLAACGKKEEPIVEEPVVAEPAVEPEPVVVEEPAEEAAEVAAPAEPEPAFRNPYTGLGEEEDLSTLRPYAVMINNIKIATPQWGNSGADIMYEVLVEGGLTRLMGIYSHLTDYEQIGSIRSSRPYYLDIAQGYDAIYIHAGGSEDAYSQISKRGINNIDGVRGSGVTFHRDPDRKAKMGLEHSLILDTAKVPDFVADANWRTELSDSSYQNMEFTDEAITAGGEAATKIHVVYSTSKDTDFEYDAETGLYMVSQYGGPMLDEKAGEAGEQLSRKNVLVLYVAMSKIAGDDKGRMKGEFTGSGGGIYFCEGAAIPITWKKDSATTPYSFFTSDGSTLQFARGTSYISIVAPTFGDVTYE